MLVAEGILPAVGEIIFIPPARLGRVFAITVATRFNHDGQRPIGS